jgi:hypothetical protein
MSELDTEDEDVFGAFTSHHHRRSGGVNIGGGLITQPTLTAADIEEVAGEEGIIAQLMDIRQGRTHARRLNIKKIWHIF